LKYLLSFGIFEQIVLALKKEFALKIFKPGVAAIPRLVRLCLQGPGELSVCFVLYLKLVVR